MTKKFAQRDAPSEGRPPGAEAPRLGACARDGVRRRAVGDEQLGLRVVVGGAEGRARGPAPAAGRRRGRPAARRGRAPAGSGPRGRLPGGPGRRRGAGASTTPWAPDRPPSRPPPRARPAARCRGHLTSPRWRVSLLGGGVQVGAGLLLGLDGWMEARKPVGGGRGPPRPRKPAPSPQQPRAAGPPHLTLEGFTSPLLGPAQEEEEQCRWAGLLLGLDGWMEALKPLAAGPPHLTSRWRVSLPSPLGARGRRRSSAGGGRQMTRIASVIGRGTGLVASPRRRRPSPPTPRLGLDGWMEARKPVGGGRGPPRPRKPAPSPRQRKPFASVSRPPTLLGETTASGPQADGPPRGRGRRLRSPPPTRPGRLRRSPWGSRERTRTRTRGTIRPATCARSRPASPPPRRRRAGRLTSPRTATSTWARTPTVT